MTQVPYIDRDTLYWLTPIPRTDRKSNYVLDRVGEDHTVWLDALKCRTSSTTLPLTQLLLILLIEEHTHTATHTLTYTHNPTHRHTHTLYTQAST